MVLSSSTRHVECPVDRQAWDSDRLASAGFSVVLALKVQVEGRATQNAPGNPSPCPGDENCQPIVGRTPDPRGTAQTRYQRRSNNRHQIHETARKTPFAGVEDVLKAPSRRHRCHGSVRRTDDLVQAALWTCGDESQPAKDTPPVCYGAPDSRLDRPSTHRSRQMEPRTTLYYSRAGRCLWGGLQAKAQGDGIRDHPTAPRSPWQNGCCERFICSIRRECLDHVVILVDRVPRARLRTPRLRT